MLSQDAIEAIKSLADQAVNGDQAEQSLLGLIVAAVGKNGEQHIHAAGVTEKGGAPLGPDAVGWVMSFTKLITTICCLQLVEQGKLKLDDSKHLEEILPTLRERPVLKPDGTLEPQNRSITLRMLLNHTAGFAYPFWNDNLEKWLRENGFNHLLREAVEKAPLLSQPGEKWMYGTNHEWAAFALEKATGLTIGEYMTKHVFQPLGMESTGMIATDSMEKRIVPMHARVPDGSLQPMGPLLRPSWDSGGIGLWSTPADYCRILAVLLNDGTCPSTGASIISKASVDELFTNQVPDQPDLGRQGFPAGIPWIANSTDDIYPVPGKPPQGWGLGGMLTPTTTGRPPSAIWWAGVANTYWWADRENGVAGVVFTQVMPFLDEKVLKTWRDFETLVYEDIARTA